MLRHTRTSLLSCVVALALTSCSREAPPVGNASVEAKRDAVEATFAEQAEAVSAGTGDSIRLDETLVTDLDIANLAGLDDKLRRINLSHTDLTDAMLKRLTRCEQLEQLRIASPRFTDEGLAVLAEMPRLRYLHLVGSPLADGAVPHLKRLTGLSALYLDGTEITLDGKRELRDALPDTHIHFDGGHYRGDPGADSHEK